MGCANVGSAVRRGDLPERVEVRIIEIAADTLQPIAARATSEPLLFKGDDFRHTDTASALT
jgi:hypothetical protein